MTSAPAMREERTTVQGLAAQRFAATNAVAEEFFGAHAEAIAQACQAMAACFQAGGRMFACGDDAQRSDVAHVVVEFLHPVVTGKRALPAIGLPPIRDDAALRALSTMAQRGDILMVLSAGALEPGARTIIASARDRGLLTIVLAGEAVIASGTNHHFAVPSADPCIVQETHEMLYHVLWELVHVFLEHRAVSS